MNGTPEIPTSQKQQAGDASNSKPVEGAPSGNVTQGLFAALEIANFKRFVSGQSISLIGSWTETVAQAILVLRLTNSAEAVGFVTAARYLPVMV